jgi:hypothetical protein
MKEKGQSRTHRTHLFDLALDTVRYTLFSQCSLESNGSNIAMKTHKTDIRHNPIVHKNALLAQGKFSDVGVCRKTTIRAKTSIRVQQGFIYQSQCESPKTCCAILRQSHKKSIPAVKCLIRQCTTGLVVLRENDCNDTPPPWLVQGNWY